MLAIRMQRTGRKGHAMFRVVVQDSRLTPTSGKVVALLGSYDPHAKTLKVDKEKAATFLGNGAQPSDRVARLLQAEGITLPSWVKLASGKSRTIRHAEKLRKNQPKKEEKADEVSPATTEESSTEADANAPASQTADAQPAAADDKQADEDTVSAEA